MHLILSFIGIAVLTFVVMLLLALFLQFAGRSLGKIATATPGLDIWLACFTWLPWVINGWRWGWVGFIATIAGQTGALYAWCALHEAMHADAAAGPRIIKFINRVAGRWQNHVSLWATVTALPIFLFIRLGEVALYPVLVILLNFPKYNQAEWVNVSRQKFSGLVGHDLIWCLYCDWMTGVYSLGADILRNVESFWCPIRFYEGKKCDNCKLDFPDIANGWVDAGGTMPQVEALLEEKYGTGERSWFGHPVRLTVKGAEPASTTTASLIPSPEHPAQRANSDVPPENPGESASSVPSPGNRGEG